MIINRSGLTIRMSVSSLRVMGRATQGVRLINLKGNDAIAAVAKVEFSEGAEDLADELNEDGENSDDLGAQPSNETEVDTEVDGDE
jgi:DNA gyrase subunit A